MIADSTLRAVEDVAVALREMRERPYGPEATGDDRQMAKIVFPQFCGGDQNQARTLWRLLVDEDCGGYMPAVVVRALVRASKTTNLVPDVTAPDPS